MAHFLDIVYAVCLTSTLYVRICYFFGQIS